MPFFAHTHKADKIARPELFRLNGISHEEKLENLLILLEDESNPSTSTVADLPTNADALRSMYGQPTVRDEMLPNVTGVNKL